jgi:hypothetical protein
MTKKAFTIILSLILLLPVAIYFTVWDYYAINIPKWDDHALKNFIAEYAQAGNWQGKIQALFKQHNEHRIALTRLFAWIDYAIFGHLNYRHLMTAGNILLLAAIPLWYDLLKKNKKPLFALVPIPFLWMTLAFLGEYVLGHVGRAEFRGSNARALDIVSGYQSQSIAFFNRHSAQCGNRPYEWKRADGAAARRSFAFPGAEPETVCIVDRHQRWRDLLLFLLVCQT